MQRMLSAHGTYSGSELRYVRSHGEVFATADISVRGRVCGQCDGYDVVTGKPQMADQGLSGSDYTSACGNGNLLDRRICTGDIRGVEEAQELDERDSESDR